ncbi:MAG TPA: zinc ribbon domain-containing protein [Ktedonobacteraceae bacterium]|nr:zinc ribbon domain-containing protein [Ktedonobacteraceae bacterium]
MPLYEYYCSDCKSKFELLVSHQHADDVICMKCHSEHVRRLLSLFAMAGKIGEESGYGDLDASAGGSCGCGGDCGCH